MIGERSAAAILTAIFFSASAFSGAQSLKWDLDSAFNELSTYSGGEHEVLQYISDRVTAAQSTFSAKRDLESRLLTVLQRPGLSPAAYDFALSQLRRVVTEQSIPVLEPMLYDQATSGLARLALEKVPVNSVTDVFIKAMQKTSGSVRAGIIYSLGERKDERAAEAITKFSGKGDSEVVRAALWALGEIGGPVAVKDLKWCRTNTLREHREFAGQSLLRAADQYLEQGKIADALEIYDLMYIRTETTELRARALQGMLRAEGDRAIETIADILRTEEPAIQEAALAAIKDLPGDWVVPKSVEALPNLAPQNQEQLIGALAERGDPAALPAIHNALRSSNAGVRHAAISALIKIGDRTSVDQLVALMLRPGVDDTVQIREALIQMDAPGVDDEIVKEVLGANNRVKTEMVEVLAARNTPNATQALLHVAQRQTAAVQVQALEGLGRLASADSVPPLIDFMVSASTPEARDAARRAVVSVLERAGQGANGAQALVGTLSRQDVPVDIRLELLQYVQSSGDDAAVPALAEIAKGDETELGLACLRALGDWPTGAALEPMSELAKSARKEPKRGVWLQAYTQLLSRSGNNASAVHLEAAAKVVQSAEEKESFLRALQASGNAAARGIAQDFVQDPDVGALAAEIVAASN